MLTSENMMMKES